jgi:hypothetical protein
MMMNIESIKFELIVGQPARAQRQFESEGCGAPTSIFPPDMHDTFGHP